MSELPNLLSNLLTDSTIIGTGKVINTNPLMVDIIPAPVINAIAHTNIWVGDVVVVARTQAGIPMIVGTATPRPKRGLIQQVDTTRAIVQLTDGNTSQLEWVSKPSVGQRVLIDWGPEGGVIIGPCSHPVNTPGVGPITGDQTTSGGAELPPTETRPISRTPQTAATTQNGKWSNYSDRERTAWQGQYGTSPALNGWYFFGGGLDMPGAKAVSGTLTLQRSSRSGVGSTGSISTTVGWHNHESQQSTPPTLTGPAPITINGFTPGAQITTELPTNVVQAFLDGTIKGFGVVDTSRGNYGVFDGPANSPASGAITLTYN